jgi:hypothetical protein
LQHQESFFGNLFDLPASYEATCVPSVPPHRSAKTQNNVRPQQPSQLTQSRQQQGQTKQKGGNSMKQSQPATTTSYASILKSNIATKDYSKMQLVVRPSFTVVLYRPLWAQVYAWSQRMASEEQSKRGRTIIKSKNNQKRQAPPERQSNNSNSKGNKIQQKAPTTSHAPKQQSNVGNVKPTNLSTKQQSKTGNANPKQKSNSSPTGNTPDHWAQYYDSHTLTSTSSGSSTAKPKQKLNNQGKNQTQQQKASSSGKPYMSFNVPLSRDLMSEYSEDSGVVRAYMATGELQVGNTSKQGAQRVTKQKSGKVAKTEASASTNNSSVNNVNNGGAQSWLTPLGGAVASVFVIGVALSTFFS